MQRHSQKAKRVVNQKPTKNKCEGIRDQFKSLDWFGQQIQLTYKGEDSYKTLIGAIVSTLLICILIGFGVFKALYLFNRINPEVAKVSLLRDITNETDNNGKIIKQKIKTDLSYQKCGDKLFQFKNPKEVIEKGISEYKCITKDDYQFQGNYYQDKFEYLEIKLWKCIDPSTATNKTKKCLDRSVVDSYFDQEVFNFAFVNTFFDLKSFEDGFQIKTFIDDSLFYELEANRIKKTNFYIQLQEAELEDDLIQFGQSKDIAFHQITEQRYYDDQYSDADGYILAMYMRFDNRYDIYTRKVYSILELLGDVGGLKESLMAIGLLIIGFISQKMFISDVMHEMYQVRKYIYEPENEQQESQQDQHGDHNNIRNMDNKNSWSPRQTQGRPQKVFQEDVKQCRLNQAFKHEPRIDQQDSMRENVDLGGSMKPFKMSQFNQDLQIQEAIDHNSVNVGFDDSINKNANKNELDTSNLKCEVKDEKYIKVVEDHNAINFKEKQWVRNDDVNSLLVSFISRMRFTYDYTSIWQYVSQCLCIRNLGRLRNKKYFKKHFIYHKGEEKLGQELDVVSLIKTLRKFRLLAQAMLSQKHRMLLRFQRQNLLETTSESSDSDDNNLDTLTLMESQNPLIRLVIYGKLKKMMKAFEGQKLKTVERNLMRGVFQRKLKDFQEEIIDQNENRTLLQRLHGKLIESYDAPKSPLMQQRDNRSKRSTHSQKSNDESRCNENDLEDSKNHNLNQLEEQSVSKLNDSEIDQLNMGPYQSILKRFLIRNTPKNQTIPTQGNNIFKQNDKAIVYKDF
ncbi:UNKNOWN [Stylonychia lemnae]|uniref:Uncharacterized protein n=1 Tax=Stylonychia lemnae TaxID=5949 RepID=A0A078AKX1_STYLE|nr:UNKNOWN [Stylonychia lemnae]|eukprot:CDW82531.1 UNKNOWN [Stylonychia lemnae]